MKRKVFLFAAILILQLSMVYGTEYIAEQPAKVWLQLLNGTGHSVDGGVCYINIFSPDGEYYVNRALMSSVAGNGMYYFDFTSPSVSGVYPALAECYYLATTNSYSATGVAVSKGTIVDGTLSNSYYLDGSTMRFLEDGPNPRGIDINWSFLPNSSGVSNCSKVSESLLTDFNVFVNGWFNSVPNDDITVSVYNWTNEQWIVLANKLLEGSSYVSSSNVIQTNNITKLGIYSAVDGVRVRTQDTNLSDNNNNNFYVDKISVGCGQLSNLVWQEVKGNSEIHVSQNPNEYPFYVETLCGRENQEYSVSSACDEFRHDDDYWNYSWGYVFSNITFINDQQSNVDSYFQYETQLGQDCTALIDVIKYFENGSSESILADVVLSGGTKQNCVLRIPIDFLEDERQFNAVVTQDNFMAWEFQRDKDLVEYYSLIIEPFCYDVAEASEQVFEIPIGEDGERNVSELYSDEPIFLSCYRAIDDLYWFEKYYNDSLLVATSGEFESYLLEARYYFPELRELADMFQFISQEGIGALFEVSTLCGDSEPSCAIAYPPDGYFRSQEGYIVENLSITNIFNTRLVADYRYSTIADVDCTAILEVLLVHSNGTVVDITDDVGYSSGLAKNCIINIPISFGVGESFANILIYMENYVHWNMFQMHDKVEVFRVDIEEYCNNISVESGVYFALPINDSLIQLTGNETVDFCYRAMDDLYWWDFFFDLHLIHTQNETGVYSVGLLEGDYAEFLYFYPFIYEDYVEVSSFLREKREVTIIAYLQQIWQWLTVDVWGALIGQEAKLNETINNTETLIHQIQGNSTEGASVKEIMARPVMQSVT